MQCPPPPPPPAPVRTQRRRVCGARGRTSISDASRLPLWRLISEAPEADADTSLGTQERKRARRVGARSCSAGCSQEEVAHVRDRSRALLEEQELSVDALRAELRALRAGHPAPPPGGASAAPPRPHTTAGAPPSAVGLAGGSGGLGPFAAAASGRGLSSSQGGGLSAGPLHSSPSLTEISPAEPLAAAPTAGSGAAPLLRRLSARGGEGGEAAAGGEAPRSAAQLRSALARAEQQVRDAWCREPQQRAGSAALAAQRSGGVEVIIGGLLVCCLRPCFAAVGVQARVRGQRGHARAAGAERGGTQGRGGLAQGACMRVLAAAVRRACRCGAAASHGTALAAPGLALGPQPSAPRDDPRFQRCSPPVRHVVARRR